MITEYPSLLQLSEEKNAGELMFRVVCSPGKARAKLSLVPRSVQRSQDSAATSTATKTEPSESDRTEAKKMTNADFRSMLLR